MATINDRFNDLVEAKDRVRELHTAIIGEVAADPDLAQLNSTSKTAVWRLWAFVTACVLWLVEQLWLTAQQEIATTVDNGIAGTPRWLAADAKKWQYGDALLVDEQHRPYYAVDHPDARLVTASAVQQRGGLALLKVAKGASAATLKPLDGDELTSFDAYINGIKFAGSNIRVISRPADLLQLPFTIYYDANYRATEVQAAVETAINAFLAAVPFNGAIYLQRLVDEIQKVPAVVDVQAGALLAQAQVTAGSPPPAAPIGRVYYPLAGYAQIDPVAPLADVLIFTPEIS